MKTFTVYTAFVVALILPLATQAQDDLDCSNSTDLAGYAGFIFSHADDDENRIREVADIYCAIRTKDPEGINKAITSIVGRSDNGLAFLKDTDFKIKTFDVENGESVLGFSYNYTKSSSDDNYRFDSEKNLTTGTAWTFSAKGNLAFDEFANPADFLDTRFSITGFRDYGGVAMTASDAVMAEFFQLSQEAAAIEDEDELAENVRLRKELVSDLFTTQTYLGFDLNAGLESNQRFTNKQWTYGANLSLDIKGYGLNNSVGMWNLLDYPFALLRTLTGFSDTAELRPLGYSFPTFVIGVDQVDPENNEARETVGETGKFDRARAEIYFRTPIARMGNEHVFANIDYRYWRELSPSNAIEAANLDRFDYLTFSISASNGVYVAYSRGMLPFDLADSKVYELGWKFKF